VLNVIGEVEAFSGLRIANESVLSCLTFSGMIDGIAIGNFGDSTLGIICGAGIGDST